MLTLESDRMLSLEVAQRLSRRPALELFAESQLQLHVHARPLK